MKYIRLILFMIFFCATHAEAQNHVFSLGEYKMTNLNGSLFLDGTYRKQEITRSNFTERPHNTIFSGELELNSRSYVWHPNFLQLDLSGELNPSTQSYNYIVIPNKSEVKTAEKVKADMTFFSMRPFTIGFSGGYSHAYRNRDYSNNVETVNSDAGARLSWSNTFLPFSMNYSYRDWTQNELDARREYNTVQRNAVMHLNKSFTNSDQNQLRISHDDEVRIFSGRSSRTRKSLLFNLSNLYYFGADNRYLWNSVTTYQNQYGSYILNRFMLNENFSARLPYNLEGKIHYLFNRSEQENYELTRNVLNTSLSHKLFRSLKSNIFYEYQNADHSAYFTGTNRFGGGFDYRKTIPYGILNLGYNLNIRIEDRDSDPNILKIRDEAVTLTDVSSELLENPDVEISSVTVTDESGLIVYQENVDYILIQRGEFVEIQRIPGGQISSGATVLVDYNAQQISSYNYTSLVHSYNLGLSLFESMLDLYFRGQEQSYPELNISSTSVLKTISRRLFGVRFNYEVVTLGAEIDDYNSNILPHRINYFFARATAGITNSFSSIVTASYKDYYLKDYDENQNFYDISVLLDYRITRASKVKFKGTQIIQQGRSIDLDLLTIRAEFETQYKQIIFSVGIESYNRVYLNESQNYYGAFLRIGRVF